MDIKVVVSVSDRYLFCLKPFSFLFNKYWSELQPVTVVGYTPPDFRLPSNFTFFSIDSPQYPKERWADGILKYMRSVDDSHFVLLLEDYFLCRRVDCEAVGTLADIMFQDRSIIRMDLTADRLYAGTMRDFDYYGRFDIVHAPGSQYELSLQAAIWNKVLLTEVLDNLPNDKRSAWDVELSGSTIVVNSGFRVFGTRQWPVRYVNAMNNALGPNVSLDGLTDEDKERVRSML